MLLEFQNKTNIEITGFLSMHFGFVFELSGTDLRNIDFLDTHLDLLDIDVPSKYFFCLHNVFKTFSRHVFKTSSRHVFKTSSRCLQGQQMFAGIQQNPLVLVILVQINLFVETMFAQVNLFVEVMFVK